MIDSAPVRLATFNVLHGRQAGADGRPSTAPGSATVGPLLDAVAALDADVVALQELDRFQDRSGSVDQARAIAEATGATDWRYVSALHARSRPGRIWEPDRSEPGMRVYGPPGTGHDGTAPSHGVALLTSLPVLAWRARRFTAPPVALPVAGRAGLTVIRDRPRAALAAVLQGRRGPFTAVALHLSYVPGWNVRQLLAVPGWIADLPRPHVLLGDFNLGGAIPTAALDAAGLLSRSRSATPRAAWRSAARVRTFPAHRPLVQLDHVLVAGLDLFRPAPMRAPGMPISDHRPLVVELPL
ncbi:endonuclease/exonuclease/phosphatase family protein [Kitasatospora sp. NPDC101801]|uniref:endonuclease/exonuclease/phosphatase family protein n=1 Tax=Kitasatospora sp. NPDC101801 TaxID=3364103 RepID=UPI0037F7F999